MYKIFVLHLVKLSDNANLRSQHLLMGKYNFKAINNKTNLGLEPELAFDEA